MENEVKCKIHGHVSNENKTKKVWATVLKGNNQEYLYQTDKVQALEEAFVEAKIAWIEKLKAQGGVVVVPPMSLAMCRFLDVQTFQMNVEQLKEETKPITNYEEVAQLLRDKGWVCYKRKAKITNNLV